MSEQVTDQILVEHVQNGDKKAFNLLVIRYQNKIANLVARYVPSADVPDVVQETFIKAYRSLGLFRGDSVFYTWIYRIAVNTSKNYLIAQSRRPPSDDIEVSDALLMKEGNSGLRDIDDPESLLLSDEVKEVIMASIKGLPEELRSAITLRELEGLSYEDIAKVMDTPVGTVRSRIFRAREVIETKLRELLNAKQ